MDDKFHLMISYSHNSKEITFKIFDWFVNQGLKTWMGRNNACTGLAENTSRVIFNTEVFIPCLSSSYEQSLQCKKELDDAVCYAKKIVPVIVEDGYQMNEEIKLLIGGNKYFDLCQNFDSAMNEVVKAVEEYTASSQPLKKLDTSAVQAEHQVSNVKNDDCFQRENSIKKQHSQDESCDEGFYETNSVEYKMKKTIEENLSDKVNQVKINKSPKITQNPDSSPNKLFTEILRKSPAADLLVEDKKRFQDKLKLALKDFRYGFGDLRKNLDVADKVIRIAEYFNLEDEDRKSIIFTDHGGGNPALSFLELLKMSQPDLKIDSFRKCLLDHSFIEAEKILTKYNGEKMFTEVSHKDARELSFKLFPPSGSNVICWKDLAGDLNISLVDVSRIDNSGKHPSKYSRTEKLFEIISMRFPHFTIGVFLDALEALKLFDAHDIMTTKIIAKM